MKRRRWLLFVGLVGFGLYELRTSALQSWLLSQYAKTISYRLEPGISPRIVLPTHGPFDERRGYTRMGLMVKRLEARGYRVVEQMRFSRELARIARWGIPPPYREPSVAGLVIRDKGGVPMYDPAVGSLYFARFEDIPDLVVQSLLLIENRELQDPPDPRSNPVLEWDRMARAGLLYAGSRLGVPVVREGGSTLATQLEKFQHSPGGRTSSLADKLQQITAASLKVYRGGPDTRARRQEIISDYLNTVPLAARPGYGEVYGLGEALYVWFGVRLEDARQALAPGGPTAAKVKVFKRVLALLAAVQAPSHYLLKDRAALEARVQYYTGLLAEMRKLDREFTFHLQRTPIDFLPTVPSSPAPSFARHKAVNTLRGNLVQLLGVRDFYELDRLHLEVESTIDQSLQNQVAEIFQQLKKPDFVQSRGLRQERLLAQGDPAKVVYSLILLERTPEGNVVRVQVDTLDKPFDINEGVKLELGSTAKLRTLAHYLEVAASLYQEFSRLDVSRLRGFALSSRDPITRWAAEALSQGKNLDLDAFLQGALDRTYSASPYALFFTGGGLHSFRNFDRSDNGRLLSVREAARRSTNLVFIWLMRDLVRFHEARLPYDAEAVLTQLDHPERRRLLTEAADEEGTRTLSEAYRKYRDLEPRAIVMRLMEEQEKSAPHLAMLFFAWHPDMRNQEEQVEKRLASWLEPHVGTMAQAQIRRLVHAYGSPRLSLADYAYLLKRHPLEVWCAGELSQKRLGWKELYARSTWVRQTSSAWLFQTRHRRAQDLRLRIRIERDAFSRMTPYWVRLGFPFQRLVPSYATAIGNSSDRPAALAELMGVIVNDGLHRPVMRVQRLRFARGTPYETAFEAVPSSAEQVMAAPVARALRSVLAGVVEAGTARRVAGAFVQPDGTAVTVGGKTGSGDNRFETFGHRGQVLSSRVVNRTATFVFYIGDNYFGVLSAFVPGREAQNYRFTSALPVAVLKQLAPAINLRLRPPERRDFPMQLLARGTTPTREIN